LVQITSDIELSGAGCTTAITPNQLVQSSSENDSRPMTCNAMRWLPPVSPPTRSTKTVHRDAVMIAQGSTPA
jgi:hypothetical protein